MADELGQLPVPGLVEKSPVGKQLRYPRGIFGEHPAYTPKYAINAGQIDDDFLETMARMYIHIESPALWQQFVDSVTAQDEDSGNLVSLLAGGGKNSSVGGNGYVDFLLQGAQHGLQEKVQIVELLADNYVAHFFGHNAPTFLYSGTLINTKQDEQAVNMVRLYRNVLRGTQLARRNQIMWLRYDSYLIAGAMTTLQWGLTAEMETAVSFSFNYLVKSIRLLPTPEYGVVHLKTPVVEDTRLLNGALTPSGLVDKVRPVRTRLIPPDTIAAATASPIDPATGPAATIKAEQAASEKLGVRAPATAEETRASKTISPLIQRGSL